MGQKVRPSALRLGIIRTWQSSWYADKKSYREFLQEDLRIRRFVREQLRNAGITDMRIERRVGDAVNVTFGTSKPGIVIGRGGAGVEALKRKIEKMTGRKVNVNVQEIKTPELNAELTAESIANAIERRISFRRAMRQAVQRAIKMGAKGIKVTVGGRLGGAEIARSETVKEGSIPLHTLRADIDYGVTTARTKHGGIGVKVWIYRGDVLPAPKARRDRAATPRVRRVSDGEAVEAAPEPEPETVAEPAAAVAEPEATPVEAAAAPVVEAVAEPAAPAEATALPAEDAAEEVVPHADA